jgi:PAS domain S-box-containing protein
MAVLRLIVFHDRVMPVAYGVPLVLFVWLRHRGLLWLTVAAFTAISFVKFFWILPSDAPGGFDFATRLLNFAIIEADLFLIAIVMHALIEARSRLETRTAELAKNNTRLETSVRELATREEEVARQNEELQSQTEELERQTEELRVTNDELSHRERATEMLLSLSRGLTTELNREEMMGRVCEAVGHLLQGAGGTSAAIVEQDGAVLKLRCYQGFGDEGPREDTLPIDRSFTSLVLSRGRAAYIEDISQRPDLAFPQPQAGKPFASVLAAPLRTLGWPVGTLEVYRDRPGPWGNDEVAVVESLAAQMSISLEALRHLQSVSQERRRFETVLRTAPVGIAVCSPECADVRLNAAGAAMFGMPPDSNILQNATMLGATTYVEGKRISHDQWPVIRAAQQGLDSHGVELEIVLPTGRRLSLLTNATPVRDASGEPAGAVAAFVDITPLKELQRELDTRRREAEEASVRKTRFLAAVSHDIRTPANAITLLAELIRRTAINPSMVSEIPELAKELHASALSLVELLGDVLDLTRYDSGRLEMLESEFSLAELLQEEQRRYAPLAREKGLELRLELPDPPLRIRADRIKLSRVIGNLVGNGIKFTATGEVSIEAGRVTDEEGTESPIIRVRDTGIGVAYEHQANIFDEFVQLHNRERDRNKGTGLGLTICKRLVDAMGGQLALISNPGQGSIFTVTLPPGSIVR